MREKVFDFMKQHRPMILVLLIGLLLMMFPNSCQKAERIKESQSELDFSLESFQKEIESILESGEGIGRVRVMLTQKTTASHIYAEETRLTGREQQNGENEDHNYDQDRKPSIISDGSGKEIPITIKQVFPEFLGAVVVCDGAESAHVKSFITETVSALTGISYDRIAIIKMKQ